MMELKARHVFGLALVCVMLIAAQVSALTIEDCGPLYTTDRTQCEARMEQCYDQFGVLLKWTGRGSRTASGQPRGDGGCQCDQYCGYFTASPCTRDPQCVWNKKKHACINRATKEVGEPILICPPKTGQPSAATTNAPTRPVEITKAPTLTPTKAPSCVTYSDGWVKTGKSHCFTEYGKLRWGWTNGPYKCSKNTFIRFQIWFDADDCDTSKGVLGGTGTVHINAQGKPVISYRLNDNVIRLTGPIKAYFGEDPVTTVNPDDLPITVTSNPYLVRTMVPHTFYFYIYFPGEIINKDCGTSAPSAAETKSPTMPVVITPQPTAPTNAPTGPTNAPTPPTNAPTPPTYAPTYPTNAPTPPTYAPTYPTNAPTPPTCGPTHSTPAPTPPTCGPTHYTHAPTPPTTHYTRAPTPPTTHYTRAPTPPTTHYTRAPTPPTTHYTRAPTPPTTRRPTYQCSKDETGWSKGTERATCFREVGFSKWGWTSGPNSNAVGSVYNFEIWFGAGQCDTSKGVLGGTGTVTINQNGQAVIAYTLNSNVVSVDEVRGYIGTQPAPEVAPGQLTLISSNPFTYPGTVPNNFYYYFHFAAHLTCSRD